MKTIGDGHANVIPKAAKDHVVRTMGDDTKPPEKPTPQEKDKDDAGRK